MSDASSGPVVRRDSRAALAVAAVLCVTYCSTLFDTGLRRLPPVSAPARPVAPPLAATDRGPRAPLEVAVVDDHDALVPGATVAVYAVRGGQAFAAGVQLTDAQGRARLERVPTGEVWILAEGQGRQRASTRRVIPAEGASARLVLAAARSFTVQVVDEAEHAVVGAQVELRGGDPLPYVATTTADGAAIFTRLGPGPWSARASAIGYEPASRSGLGELLLPPRLVLRSLGTMSVKVLDPSGNPAAGARVELAGAGVWPARTAAVGDDGTLRIAALPAGAYSVVASRDELVSETVIGAMVARGEVTSLELRLGEGRKIAVRVVDGEGDDAPPVARAEVVMAEDGLSSFPRRALTDASGEVWLGPVGTHPITLGARADGFVARAGVRLAAGDRGPVRVSLVRGGVLTGEVVDRRGDPVDGASVEIVGVDFAGMPIDETPDHRRFQEAHFAWALTTQVNLIPAGELGVMPGPLPSIPHGRSTLGASFGLPQPAASTSSGASPPATPDESSMAPAPWVSDRDGRFRATPVTPGRVRALVRHPAYVEALSEAVTLASGGEAHVKVVLRAGGTIEGRVVDAGGHPVAGARVEAAAAVGSTLRSVVSADDGTFTFVAVPGEVSLAVSRPDRPDEVALRKVVEVDEGAKREVELMLPQERDSIEVRVVDDRGYPLDNVQVSALSLAVASPLRVTRFSRGDGVVVLPDAAGLPLRLEVSLSGYAPVTQTTDAALRELRVTLGRASSIEGLVTGRSGRETIANATLTVRAGTFRRTDRTDSEGRFTMRGLPPGPARLQVQSPGHAPVERAIVIGPPDDNRPTRLDPIDLAEGASVEGEVVDHDGHPVVGARVAVGTVPAFLPLGPLPAGVAVTDSRGHFALDDLGTEAPLTLEAFAADHGRGRSGDLRLTAGNRLRDVRITLDRESDQSDPATAGGVAVTLVDASSGGSLQLAIRAVAPNSEAERGGIEVDDVLVRIDDQAPTSLEDARRRLSGPLGDDVVLVLRRRGDEVKLRVARERVRR